MLEEHEQGRSSWRASSRSLRPTSAATASRLLDLRDVFAEYATLLKNHFWKENDILYPMALRVMTPRTTPRWSPASRPSRPTSGRTPARATTPSPSEIVRPARLDDLSFGLDREVLAAMLNTLPVELSFVDADDTVRYFSHENRRQDLRPHPRRDRHEGAELPPAEEPARGRSRSSPTSRPGRATWPSSGSTSARARSTSATSPVRSRDGRYLGCLEIVQDVTRHPDAPGPEAAARLTVAATRPTRSQAQPARARSPRQADARRAPGRRSRARHPGRRRAAPRGAGHHDPAPAPA